MSNGGAARKRVKILSKFACENRDLPDQNMPFLRSKSPPEPRQRTAPQPLALACRWLGAAELLWLAQAVRVGRPASGPCMLSSTTDTQARLSGKRMHVSCLIHDLLLGHCGLSACRISLMTPCSFFSSRRHPLSSSPVGKLEHTHRTTQMSHHRLHHKSAAAALCFVIVPAVCGRAGAAASERVGPPVAGRACPGIAGAGKRSMVAPASERRLGNVAW